MDVQCFLEKLSNRILSNIGLEEPFYLPLDQTDFVRSAPLISRTQVCNTSLLDQESPEEKTG